MAETRNTFVKSKMNKDLDDRLLSNGEYREAQNVNISRSEGEDVGALENVLGNKLKHQFSSDATETIGYYSDETNNRLFIFNTDHTDSSDSQLDGISAYGSSNRIFMVDLKNNSSSLLVYGEFLNFSKTHPIYGVNIIEDLLFWTDNRNQPRKININKALANSSYYNKEQTISVAKYYPYNAPLVYETLTMSYTSSANYTFPSPRTDTVTELTLTQAQYNKVKVGMIFKRGKEVTGNLSIPPGTSVGGGGLNTENFPGVFYVRSKVIDTSTNPDSYKLRLNGVLENEIESTGGSFQLIYASGQDKSSKYLKPSCSGIVSQINKSVPPDGIEPGSTFTLNAINGVFPEVGMKLSCPGKDNIWDSSGGVTNSEYLITAVARLSLTTYADIANQTGTKVYPPNDTPSQDKANSAGEWNEGTLAGQALITVSPAPMNSSNPIILNGDIVAFSSPNPNYDINWPGDKAYLEDKFVRFAYRFKFDDGEYSLISPFTQPVFIPKQNGYFLDHPTRENNKVYIRQEDTVGNSTIVSFMENKINNVSINIETPYRVDQLENELKVEEIDILYKESDGLAIQLVESIPVTDSLVTGNSSFSLTYDYQSKKPFRVLPEKEVSRVSDKVPIRALSQSVVGNRVVYGNFIDKHSPPNGLDYNVDISAKYTMDQNIGWEQGGQVYSATPVNPKYSIVSYPNHSLKQNRTYQVGIVLSDIYGRQSDVILATDEDSSYSWNGGGIVDLYANTASSNFGGSTIYSKYNDFFPSGDYNYKFGPNGGSVYRDGLWYGDSLKVLFRNKIPSTQTGEYAEGYPGLYKSGLYYAYVPDPVSNNSQIIVSYLDPNISVGDIMFIDSNFVSILGVNASTKAISISQAITTSSATTVTIFGPENKLGWYSYKVVVKQTEQEYYNIYLPNISLPSDVSSLENSFASQNLSLTGLNFYTSLISDNINKIGSDLQEVQPEQTQFRTSNDILYPRIGFNSSLPDAAGAYYPFSSGFFEGQSFITVNGIGKVTDLGLQQVNLDGVSLGRILTFTGGTGATVGNVVYNLPLIGGSGTGAQVKVGVTTGTTVNYVVVTNTGKDYKPDDTFTIAARSTSTQGYVTGQATWAAITLAASDWNITPEKGTDTEPRTAAGIYNAASNPTTMAISSENEYVIGQAADSRNMVFSALEIKPLNSRLEIFWETSTGGLISDLNKAIEDGSDATKN